MSVWTGLCGLIDSGIGLVGGFADRVMTFFAGDPEGRREYAFSAAMIGLAAKMAKADGVVTGLEVGAFRRLFDVPEGEARNVERLFNLARQDVAGYRAYAERVAGLYGKGAPMMEDILDGLFFIATADHVVHEAELAYLADVAGILGLTPEAFERIKARHVVPEEGDPYVLLGAERRMSDSELRRHYLALVAETHPDRFIARGVPQEFLVIATRRLAVINAAWARVAAERGIR
jgi:DnaJ like chaperone protein